MSENTDLTYYQKKKKKDVVWSKAEDCYKKNKDRLREQANDKYRNLSKQEKKKKKRISKK